jgi:hypothetical protein
MIKTVSFTYEYNYFKPGTMVTPTSQKCPLAHGRAYQITRCAGPRKPGQGGTCHVKGRRRGLMTEHLREVQPEEKLPIGHA